MASLSVNAVELGTKILKAELLMVSDFGGCFVITSGPITSGPILSGSQLVADFPFKKPDYG